VIALGTTEAAFRQSRIKGELIGSHVHQSSGNGGTSMTILAYRLMWLVACEDLAGRRPFKRRKLSALFGTVEER